jgi:hypothetical protein
MTNFRVYPETEFRFSTAKNELLVSLPWLSGTLPIPEQYQFAGEAIAPSDVENLFNSSSLFSPEELLSFPFCQQGPRQLNEFSSRETDTRHFNYVNHYSDLLANLGYVMDNGDPITNAFPFVPQWDMVAILNECGIPGTTDYDPVSLYTILRRWRNKPATFKRFSATLHQQLKQCLTDQKDEVFFEMILLLLAQSYYITSNCVDSLTPALLASPYISAAVKQYIQEETGHHHLIWRSVKEITTEPGRINGLVFREVITLMTMLKNCAGNYPVAFCCLLGSFEQSSQFESDPLGDLLLQSSKPTAANGINTHFRINKKGNHSEIGLDLVKLLPPCNKEQVLAATQYLELMTLLLETIAYRVIEKQQLAYGTT